MKLVMFMEVTLQAKIGHDSGTGTHIWMRYVECFRQNALGEASLTTNTERQPA